jgi:hypothetical protein
MDSLTIDGISHHGEKKVVRAGECEDMILIDTEERGQSGVLLTKSQAELLGKFLQEVNPNE